jgi:hypothetical protein
MALAENVGFLNIQNMKPEWNGFALFMVAIVSAQAQPTRTTPV